VKERDESKKTIVSNPRYLGGREHRRLFSTIYRPPPIDHVDITLF